MADNNFKDDMSFGNEWEKKWAELVSPNDPHRLIKLNYQLHDADFIDIQKQYTYELKTERKIFRDSEPGIDFGQQTLFIELLDGSDKIGGPWRTQAHYYIYQVVEAEQVGKAAWYFEAAQLCNFLSDLQHTEPQYMRDRWKDLSKIYNRRDSKGFSIHVDRLIPLRKTKMDMIRPEPKKAPPQRY